MVKIIPGISNSSPIRRLKLDSPMFLKGVSFRATGCLPGFPRSPRQRMCLMTSASATSPTIPVGRPIGVPRIVKRRTLVRIQVVLAARVTPPGLLLGATQRRLAGGAILHRPRQRWDRFHHLLLLIVVVVDFVAIADVLRLPRRQHRDGPGNGSSHRLNFFRIVQRFTGVRHSVGIRDVRVRDVTDWNR